MRRFYFVTLIIAFLLVIPSTAEAIPPPDLIINIGSQVAQIFALLVVLFSAAAGVIGQYFKIIFAKMKGKKFVIGLSALVILVVSLVAAFYVEQRRIELAEAKFAAEVSNTIQVGIMENDVVADPAEDETSNFFETNQGLALVVSNEEFLVLQSSRPFVLDAREDEEFEIGFYPGSHHIRFADVLAGSWTQLPTDRIVYVMCWSGIRGSETVKFLREKGIIARYLEDGAKGWVDGGGTWQGEILFSTKYSNVRYTGTLSTEEVKTAVANGAVLVDARQKEVFDMSHFPGSINISIFFSPTSELDALFLQVPVGSSVVTICDDFVSCFDAKIAGVKLEKRGMIFLGRYSTPWDY